MRKQICYLAILLTSFLFGCPSEPNNPDKPNPCIGKIPVSADFDILEELWYDSSFVTDGALTGNIVHFTAKGNFDSYEWRIGTMDSVFTAKSIRLTFKYPEKNIPIRLIVQSKPDTSCFPYDDGIDTVYKKLSIFTDRGGSAMLGDYYGCNQDNPKDSFVVSIYYYEKYESGTLVNHFYYHNNINKGCIYESLDSSNSHIRLLMGFKHMRLDMTDFTDPCLGPQGYAYLSEDNKYITIDYTQSKDNKNRLDRFKKKYIGRRL